MVEHSVFGEWHKDVRRLYVNVIKALFEELKSIPRFPGSGMILDDEIDRLKSMCETFDVDIDDDINLKDVSQFLIVKGKIYKKIKEILEKELKPEDPFYRFIQEQQLDEEEMREFMKQMQGGQHEEMASKE